jgi:ribosomal protein S18 acetylase RimI-like enzyme
MLFKQEPVTRQITHQDRTTVSNLIHFSAHVHRHLDWRSPLEWIGHPPFDGLEINGKLISILSCAPDTPGIAWIRAFACELSNYYEKAWKYLWDRAIPQLPELGVDQVAAIPIQKWFRKILEFQGFDHLHNIITLAWDHAPLTHLEEPPPNITIRQMAESDLDIVFQIDHQAFDPLWQHSKELIELAHSQSKIATIAEDSNGPVGYQISTPTQYGFHLGRLAVSPGAQRQGIGFALVRDLQHQTSSSSPSRISVNTHDTNTRSIALYAKAGFSKTNEIFPVYRYKI